MKFAKGTLAFAIVCFLCTLSIAAQATQKGTRLGSSNIAVDLPTKFAENEEVILYPVNINIDGYQVADYQFSILYDPSVLTATAPSAGCSSAGTMTGDMGLSVTCFIPQ